MLNADRVAGARVFIIDVRNEIEFNIHYVKLTSYSQFPSRVLIHCFHFAERQGILLVPPNEGGELVACDQASEEIPTGEGIPTVEGIPTGEGIPTP